LPELVCASHADYIAMATRLGLDRTARDRLRDRLRQGRDSCVLFDLPLLVRHLEALFERMATEFAAGRRPRPDLANMALYREIGIDLASDNDGTAAIDPEFYRREMIARSGYRYIAPDQRLSRCVRPQKEA
jgi:hypothetical protein